VTVDRSAAFLFMIAGYLAGAIVALIAPSDRIARGATAIGAASGSLAGLVVALAVLATGDRFELVRPDMIAVAGGVAIQLDSLGALFLALVCSVGLFAAVYGFTYTADYDGRRSLRFFGLMFNAFLLGMSLVPCAANVFTFLFAWELMAVASYFLVMTEHESSDARGRPPQQTTDTARPHGKAMRVASTHRKPRPQPRQLHRKLTAQHDHRAHVLQRRGETHLADER